jgi:hypothetical protein
MTTTSKTFQIGNIYEMRFIGDSDLKISFKCVKRTAKTVTMESVKGSESLTRRIKTSYDNIEYVLKGSYSMAPAISADKLVG